MEWGGLFHDINLKKNGGIEIPRFSTTTYMWFKFAQVLVTYVKHLLTPTKKMKFMNDPFHKPVLE
jgi:hypothetical protein